MEQLLQDLKQQNFKNGRLHIAVNATLSKVLIAVCFDID